MEFLKSLFIWFINGSTLPNESPNAESPATPKKTARNSPRISFEFNRIDDINPTILMEELNSIEPMTKQFEKARADMLQELRKLALLHRPVRKSLS
jgi:hypothetical protein